MSRDTTLQSDITKGNPTANDGSFKRADASFRNHVKKGAEFAPESGRYHLYVSYACPWAHRTLIYRKVKGLEDHIPVSVVSPRMGAQGWPFANVDAFPGATTDPVNGAEHVKDIYLKTEPNYGGRFTVPVLWDTKTSAIVNNESSEIIRIFNTEFNDLLTPEQAKIDLYPEDLRAQIDEVNSWVYDTVNNGVYKSGFATTQAAYEAAVKPLFASLDRLEKMLEGKEYLLGDQLTEADVRLYTTIVRFDPVYHGHFKCNFKTIRGGYPNINEWCKRLYWKNEAFKSTTEFNHIKTHYYWSHGMINPTRVVPLGPVPAIEPLN
ncbi:glutathione S-transferase [Hysterangium stoloniferum]|nr:glutathione S-transferase [Hysterangium stoloniferum]